MFVKEKLGEQRSRRIHLHYSDAEEITFISDGIVLHVSKYFCSLKCPYRFDYGDQSNGTREVTSSDLWPLTYGRKCTKMCFVKFVPTHYCTEQRFWHGPTKDHIHSFFTIIVNSSKWDNTKVTIRIIFYILVSAKKPLAKNVQKYYFTTGLCHYYVMHFKNWNFLNTLFMSNKRLIYLRTYFKQTPSHLKDHKTF